MATIKIQDGKVILKDGKVSCECCTLCVSGNSGFPFLPIPEQVGPCIDFLTATTTSVRKAGLYTCRGRADDSANINWPGGNYVVPPSSGDFSRCIGPSDFEFTTNLNVGDRVSCEAGSWGGIVGCRIICCPADSLSGNGIGLSLL